jgi:transcriptional regulator with XRE-family HTH domain
MLRTHTVKGRLGNLIQTELTNRKWVVGDLAEALGLPRKSTTPYGWLAGRSAPPNTMRSKLAEVLGVPEKKLLQRKPNGKAPAHVTAPIEPSPFPPVVLSFEVNTAGTATIKLEATLSVEDALPLLRTLIGAGVLVNTKEAVSDE